MEKQELFNLEMRRKIYNYIKDNPGLHLHELARKMNINYNNLRYHIQHLEKYDMIVLKSNNSYTHVYPKENLSRREKEIFNIIRQETPRNILLVFINYIIASQIDLAEILEKHPTTIEYHLKKLQDLGLIQNVETRNGLSYAQFSETYVSRKVPKKNEKLYSIKDFGLILRIFWTYKQSFENDEVFKFALQNWLDTFHRGQKENHEAANGLKEWLDSRIDRVIKVLFDIFPPPYAL